MIGFLRQETVISLCLPKQGITTVHVIHIIQTQYIFVAKSSLLFILENKCYFLNNNNKKEFCILRQLDIWHSEQWENIQKSLCGYLHTPSLIFWSSVVILTCLYSHWVHQGKRSASTSEIIKESRHFRSSVKSNVCHFLKHRNLDI
jgi:hypothetical protein